MRTATTETNLGRCRIQQLHLGQYRGPGFGSLLVRKEFVHVLDEAYSHDHRRAGRAQEEDDFKKTRHNRHKKHDRIVTRLPSLHGSNQKRC
jgi:hypothetical protein